MAKTPNIKVKVTPVVDTDAIDAMKYALVGLGLSLHQAMEQVKPAFQAIGDGFNKLGTQLKIAQAFDVPPEMLGLLPPDAGETVSQAVFDGSLTGEVYLTSQDGALHAWDDTGVLPIGVCPANTAPYVPGQLGINSKLVAQQPTGWQSKASAEIMADLQAVADLYKGKGLMPSKTFKAGEPDPGKPLSGIPAHAVFTSGLIHTQEEAKAKVQQLLKTSGDVKAARLDDQGNQTGEWITLGQMSDFSFLELGHTEAVTEALKQKKAVDGLQEKITVKQHQQASFDVLGKAQPVVVTTPILPKSWYQNPQTGASYTEIEDGVCEVVLIGQVPDDKAGNGVIQQTHVLTKDAAEQLTGLKPMGGNFVSPTQYISGKPYFWDPAKGWTPKTGEGTVSTALEPEVEDLLAPEQPPVLTDAHQIAEHHWTGEVIHAQAHLWCTAHNCHWVDPVHPGDLVSCDSGGWLRESTPLEDKQVLAKIRMMHDTGLL